MVKASFSATAAFFLFLVLCPTTPVLAQPWQRPVTGNCPVGSSIRVINADGSVVCQVDANSGGTVTSVSTGSGLTGGPITSTGTISVDPAQVQSRVTGSCVSGGAIRVINQDGTATCQSVGSGTVTAVTASAPLVSSGGTTPNISLPNVIMTGPDNSGKPGNTAIGVGALQSNTRFGNTASGASALQSNTSGADNTASGAMALFSNTTGSDNTASGASALLLNTTGSENTASGFSALLRNSTGSNNTASGAGALLNNMTGNLNTASGDSALLSNSTGNGNTATGVSALLNNSTGTGNTAIGGNALHANFTGSSNTAVGSNTDVGSGALTNATAIGAGAIVDASNKVRLGDVNVAVIEGQVPFSFTSDQTKKENFQPVDGEEVLRKLRGLSLTSWNYIGHDPKQFRHYGPMGQEFFAAFGHDAIGTIGSPTTLTASDLAGILMSAVQALERRSAEQRAAIETLRAENAVLQGRLQALETSVQAIEALAQR